MAQDTADQRGFEGRLVHRERQPNNNFDIFEPVGGVPTEFADGFGQVLMAPAVSKISLYTTEDVSADETGAQVETRRVSRKLVVPTRTLVEFCMQTLSSLKANKALLEQYNNQQIDLIDKAAASFEPPTQS